MLTAHKTFNPFNRPQKPLRFVGVYGVLNVFAVRNQLQIFQSVIASVKVFMVNFKPTLNRTYERFPERAVNRNKFVPAVFAQTHALVMLLVPNFNWPIRLIPNPRPPLFNRHYRCNAGAQERGNFFQFSSLRQHPLGFSHLFGGKFFAPCYAPYFCNVANFIQTFVPQYRAPFDHASLPSVKTYNKHVCIGGQA